MASRKGGVPLPERRGSKTDDNKSSSITSRFSQSSMASREREAASNAIFVSKKLLRSTGKAAWIAGTTLLVLVVPLIIEMDREQQLNELQLQQASLLGAPSAAPPRKTLDRQA